MAKWVKCQTYTEDREPIYINLDLIVAMRPHPNGSVLVAAVPDKESYVEYIVWDSPEAIIAQSETRYA